MQSQFRRDRVVVGTWLVVYFVAIVWLVVPGAAWTWLGEVRGEVAAAWAQAAISGVAILASALLLNWQLSHDRREAEERERQQKARHLSGVRDLLDVARFLTEDLLRLGCGSPDGAKYREHLGAGGRVIAISAVLASMDAIDLASIPGGALKVHFASAREKFREVRDLQSDHTLDFSAEGNVVHNDARKEHCRRLGEARACIAGAVSAFDPNAPGFESFPWGFANRSQRGSPGQP